MKPYREFNNRVKAFRRDQKIPYPTFLWAVMTFNHRTLEQFMYCGDRDFLLFCEKLMDKFQIAQKKNKELYIIDWVEEQVELTEKAKVKVGSVITGGSLRTGGFYATARPSNYGMLTPNANRPILTHGPGTDFVSINDLERWGRPDIVEQEVARAEENLRSIVGSIGTGMQDEPVETPVDQAYASLNNAMSEHLRSQQLSQIDESGFIISEGEAIPPTTNRAARRNTHARRRT